MLCKGGGVFPCKKIFKNFWNFKRAVIHIAEIPAENVRKWNLSRALGRSSTIPQLFKQRGYRGYQTFAEIFYCIILQTGRVPTICVYSITIASLIPSAYQGREGGVYIK
jgi:hypothetical protein